MARVVDARGVRRAIQWRWRDLVGPALVAWACLMALMVYFDVRLLEMLEAGARRSAAVTFPDGTHPRSYSVALLAVSLGLHGVMIVAVMFMQHLAAMARVVKRRASARQCPCCGYGLAGIAPEEDGARVCPECGAAWRFNLDSSVNVQTYPNRALLRHW